MILVSGFNVYPNEIEDAVLSGITTATSSYACDDTSESVVLNGNGRLKIGSGCYDLSSINIRIY